MDEIKATLSRSKNPATERVIIVTSWQMRKPHCEPKSVVMPKITSSPAKAEQHSAEPGKTEHHPQSHHWIRSPSLTESILIGSSSWVWMVRSTSRMALGDGTWYRDLASGSRGSNDCDSVHGDGSFEHWNLRVRRRLRLESRQLVASKSSTSQ